MSTNYRHSARTPRLFFLDARAAVILLAASLHISWWTFGIAGAAIAGLVVMERYGYNFMSAMRAIRCWIAGPDRPALDPKKIRGFSDTEAKNLP